MQDLHYFYKVFYKKHTIILKQKDHYGKYIKIRQQYPYFKFVDYAFTIYNNELDIKFIFDLAGVYKFAPGLKLLHRDFIKLKNLSHEALSNMIFQIGMIELISYWKLACPPKLIIEPHALSLEQIDWWKKLYYHGLGEFFYLNGITPDKDDFVDIQSKGKTLQLLSDTLSSEKVIVPVGGGKDSVVTLELLKNSDFQIIPMALNPREASIRTIESAGFRMNDSVVVERTLDPLMLELNTQGFLNGHTPFSALLAFVNVLTAVVSGTKYVSLSNENSANESTVPGSDINHQYSKSFEFEKDFSAYCKSYIHPELTYFSFLRPLSELQIAGLFASFSAHFSGFRSCNIGSKSDKWCGKCPKCLFTYIILSPFVSREQLQKIFGKDLLNDEELKPIFNELIGISPIKPFECVGTPYEIKVALGKALKELSVENRPALLKDFSISESSHYEFEKLITSFNTENLVPLAFLRVLMEQLQLPLKRQFQLFIQNKFGINPEILILGFGKEGQSTYQLLRCCYPEKPIHIADKSDKIKDLEIIAADTNLLFHLGESYQAELECFPIIFKSPGVKFNTSIPPFNQIYSQADLFLEFFGDQTIGVTGTKGKSTTSSLIHHLLEKSGKDSVLLGNIGVPPFDMLENIHRKTTIIYELSAHQLEYVHHSPHIGILLNIFPEHLDYFDSFDDYILAKNNIFRYQKANDLSIVKDEFSTNIRGRKLVYSNKKLPNIHAYSDQNKLFFLSEDQYYTIDNKQIALKGDHNRLNILAAMLAVSAFGIPNNISFSHLSSFKSLPHRLEFLGRYKGVDYYNDSISTVPESTMAAIHTLQHVKTIILGGYDRGIDYASLVNFIEKSAIKNLLFLGKAGNIMMKLFEKNHSLKNLVKVENMEHAVQYAMENTSIGICLLSPAAASYDQFDNFEHRGDEFKKQFKCYGIKKSG